MDQHTPTRGAPGGTSRSGASRRLSVWHYLVVIALLPTLCLPVLTGFLIHDRLVVSARTTQIEDDLLAASALDQLRQSLSMESSVEPFTVLAGQFGSTPAMFGSLLGWTLPTPEEAEAATDSALKAAARYPQLRATLARVRTEVPSIRAAVARAAKQDAAGLAPANTRYMDMLEVISDAEQALAHRVSYGNEGSDSARLRARINAFDVICEVIISHMRGAGHFYRTLLADEPRKSDLDSLVWEAKRYEVLSARLGEKLDPEWADKWEKITSTKEHRIFEETMAKGPAAIPGLAALRRGDTSEISALVRVVPALKAMMFVMDELSVFLRDAARDTADISRAEATGQRHRAIMAAVSTGMMVVLTLITLFVFGGTLRRRLARVAEGARWLSAGHLDLVEVFGPREVAATSEALNAAVTTLRHVEAKAILLASGDLDSVELEQPAPGPLGAAVHASVSRIVTAVREREELQRQLAHQASHDALTGLPNRAELDRALCTAVDRAQRRGTPISVLFVDLDGFKACNDRYGHAAGDQVLEETARRLNEAVRPGDVVGRLGGDEFVVVVEGVPPGEGAVRIGQRIVDTVSQPIDYEGKQLHIGASVGLAGCDTGQTDAEQLLSEADAAVYHAKASGRGCVMVHDENLRAALNH